MRFRTTFFALALGVVAGLVQAQDGLPPDLTAALLAVQRNRAAMLDAQIKGQVEVIQARALIIQNQNTVLNTAAALRATLPATAAPQTATPVGAQTTALEQAFRSTGIGFPIATVGQLDLGMQQLRSLMDANNNAQQMDMLRLQSLGNKYNPGSTIVTNEAKKAPGRADPGPMR